MLFHITLVILVSMGDTITELGNDFVTLRGRQLIKALTPPPPDGPESPQAQPGSRIMHGASATPFQAPRVPMETEWVPQMMQMLGLDMRRCRSSGMRTS